MTHCDRLLEALADGRAHSTSDLHRRCGNMIVHSRIADLRKKGHDILHEHVPGKKGAAAHRYTWVDAPARPAQQSFNLTTDEIAPRTENERFRIFRVRDGGHPEIVCTVSSPEAVGVALCRLGDEGEFDDYCVGIQDALDRWDAKQGKYVGRWIVKPWQGRD